MKFVTPYLSFTGNCRQAMTFYKKCLGGELSFQTAGEAPMSDKMPKKMKDCILHSKLSNGSLLLMGSDMVGENGLLKGNAVSLMLNCTSEKAIRTCYKKLSAGGQQTHPIENIFWGALFGGLTDKYGNSWMLNYNKITNTKKVKK
jgi:PhnB protein